MSTLLDTKDFFDMLNSDMFCMEEILTRRAELRQLLEEDSCEEDAAVELEGIDKFISELGGECDPGVTFISYNYFETYVQEYAISLGLIQGDDRWPYYCIDWEYAAKEISYDYSAVWFDGKIFHYLSY